MVGRDKRGQPYVEGRDRRGYGVAGVDVRCGGGEDGRGRYGLRRDAAPDAGEDVPRRQLERERIARRLHLVFAHERRLAVAEEDIHGVLDSRNLGGWVEVARIQDRRAIVHLLAVLPVEAIGRNVRHAVGGFLGVEYIPIIGPKVADALALFGGRLRVVAFRPGRHHLVGLRLPTGIGGERLGKVVGLDRRRGHYGRDLLPVSGKPHEGFFDLRGHFADLSFALRLVVVLQIIENQEVRAEYALCLAARTSVESDGFQNHAGRREWLPSSRIGDGRKHDAVGCLARVRRLAVVLLCFRPLVCTFQFQKRNGYFWEVLDERGAGRDGGENVLDDA